VDQLSLIVTWDRSRPSWDRGCTDTCVIYDEREREEEEEEEEEEEKEEEEEVLGRVLAYAQVSHRHS